MKKRENKRGMSKAMLVGIIAFALLLGIILISALTTEEQNALENELNSLKNELSSSGYNWLVNYSLNSSEINITTNYSLQTTNAVSGWSLVVGEGIEFDYIVDPTPGATNVSNCSTLSTANTYYQLNRSIDDADVTLTADCIIISAQNITFDCDGYYISQIENYTGVYSNQYNTTVKNCNVSMGVGVTKNTNANSIGIEIVDAGDNSNVINNTVIGGGMDNGIWIGSENTNISNNIVNVSNGTGGDGITLSSANNNSLSGNSGTSNNSHGIYLKTSANNNILTNNTGTSSSYIGIYLSSSSNNNLTSNTGTSNSSVGIYLETSSNNNILTSNTGTSTSNAGIYLYSSSNNTLTGNTGTSNTSNAVYLVSSHYNILNNTRAEGYLTGSRGIYIQTSNHTVIRDCINVSGVTGDIEYLGISINNTFINCSYRITGTNESVTDGSQLIRKWYYRSYVNDSSGSAVPGANVSAYNVSGAVEFHSLMTNSSGWTNITEITEYVNSGGTRSYYSNYSIISTKGGYADLNKSYNVSSVDGTGGVNNNLAHNLQFSGSSSGYNLWNCTSGNYRWDNSSCWSFGRLPVAGDNVLFNGTGRANCNITNNTLPQNLNSFTVNESYNGTIEFLPLFAVGNWTGRNDGTQLWNVTNNIVINNGTMKIWGDYRLNDTYGIYGNITNDGHGQEWRSVNGNVTIGASANLDGVGLGFYGNGPAAGSLWIYGGGYGGMGGKEDHPNYYNKSRPYGSITQPTSLGSGGDSKAGGSGIKLDAYNNLTINGRINMAGVSGSTVGASGGSIWLISNTFIGNGTIIAYGGSGTSSGNNYGGGGGRISINYNSSAFNGEILINGGRLLTSGQSGTLYEPNRFINQNNVIINSSYHYYFSNSSTVYNLNLTINNNSDVYFSNGTLNIYNLAVNNISTLRFDVNYSGGTGTDVFDMNSLNISGEINVTNSSALYLPAEGTYNLGGKLYVDSNSKLYVLGNTTAINSQSGGNSTSSHGIGVTINCQNATILGIINGDGSGFVNGLGPAGGSHWSYGASYGGRGNRNTKSVYGNETLPTALGSGGAGTAGYVTKGGGAIKINATDTFVLNGNISVKGVSTGQTSVGGSGGSILLISNTFTGNGKLYADGGDSAGGSDNYGGGGGRITIYATTFNLSGLIRNIGGLGTSGSFASVGSGGTVYINATNIYLTGSTIDVSGFNGSTGGSDWGQRINISSTYMKLSGVYNASELNKTAGAGTVDGTITLTFTDCTSDAETGVYDPSKTVIGSCSYGGTNLWNCTSGNYLWNNASCWSLGRVPSPGDNVIFNSTGRANVNITNNTLVQNLNSFTVNESYNGTIEFLPLFAVGSWTGRNDGTQLWNVTGNIVINNGTMKIWGDYRLNETKGSTSYQIFGNITNDGHGQEWRSVNGNVTIGVSAVLDGISLGLFIGPGTSSQGATYGGKGEGSTLDFYGNATAPTSLGSKGRIDDSNVPAGGSAIKLQANNNLIINGKINMSANIGNYVGASGGSIWLIANNISGSGALDAKGVEGGSGDKDGGGGRIAVNYSYKSFTGTINVRGGNSGEPGTFYVSNYSDWFGENITMNNIGYALLPQNFSFNTITLNSGAQLNILTNSTIESWLNVKNFTILDSNSEIRFRPDHVLSEYWNSSGTLNTTYIDVAGKMYFYPNKNITGGKGGTINVVNFTLRSSGIIDQRDLGFNGGEGPGFIAGYGANHGGRGASKVVPYGNETMPTTIGSGGRSGFPIYGGGAIKINATGTISFYGVIDVRATASYSDYSQGSGGSIWLIGNNIIGNGTLNASANTYGGGTGRIALTSTGTINFTGKIENKGRYSSSSSYSSGGTVYINASQVYLTGAVIDVSGYNGSTGGADWGQRINISSTYMKLSGTYNSSRVNKSDTTTVDGTITLSFTDCTSDTELGTYDPSKTVIGSCNYGGTNLWNCTSGNYNWNNASCWSLGRIPSPGDNVIFNSTGRANVNITNNTLVQNLNSFTVDAGYNGTIEFLPLFAVGSWTGRNDGTQLWNVTGNIVINNGTMKIWGDYRLNETKGSTSYQIFGNITNDGHGQEWRSTSGNITIGASANLDGVGLGFTANTGPGVDNGADGYSAGHLYGNASAPTSLGSGDVGGGGSAIKLDAFNNLVIFGNLRFEGTNGDGGGASGGSIWLKANNISGSGVIKSDGGLRNWGGAGDGGRIRLDYGNNLELTVNISTDSKGGNKGTLTFTNNTWSGNWTLTGNIGLLGGDYGEGNVTNVLGNFNTNGYNLTIYGDCFGNSGNYLAYVCYNKTFDGRGVWINASGDINISSGSVLGGSGLGFPVGVGPGGPPDPNGGATYGGRGGNNVKNPYGSEIAPVSLGTGSGYQGKGSSAIRLQTSNEIIINGVININGGASDAGGGSGGSIYLYAGNISGNGNLSGNGGSTNSYGYGGGGGRIALTSINIINFTGIINNKGGISAVSYPSGSGGTVYINATNIYLTGSTIDVSGYNGSIAGADWGQRINISSTYMKLSGTYNASELNKTAGAGTVDGTITLNYTDCASDFNLGTFDPNPTYLSSCGSNITINITYPLNNVYYNINVSQINYTAIFNRPKDRCWYSNSSGVWNSSSVAAGTNFSDVISVEGSNSWSVYCNDTNNGINSSSISFVKDMTNPGVSFVAPTLATGSYTTNSSVLINVSLTDANLKNITYNWNNTNYNYGSNYSLVSPVNLTSGLVLLMHMDNETSYGENSTYVVDFSGNSNNGTLYNGSTVCGNVPSCPSLNSSGRYRSGMQFDGVDDFVNAGNSNSINITGNQITVSTWIYPTENGRSQMIADKLRASSSTAYRLGKQSSNKITIEFYNSSSNQNIVYSATAPTLNEWTFVTGTYNGSSISIYFNGVLNNYTAASGNIASGSPSSLLIGKNVDYTTDNFNGTIDEVAIWNRSLSANEVRQIYESTMRKYPSLNKIYLLTDFNASGAVGNSTMQIESNNSLNWYLLINQSGLLNGNSYNYFVRAGDMAGNSNSTENRSVGRDTVNPSVLFVSPTLANGTFTPNNYAEINVSISENNLNELKYNWNGTNFTFYNDSLVLMMNFDNLSAIGENSSLMVDVSKYCYDNETEILTLEEISCDEVDCGDEGIYCENSIENGKLINFMLDDESVEDIEESRKSEENKAGSEKTEKCYIKKWKLFKDLNGKEKVMTLNNETGEKEFEKPLAYQTFEHEGDMYRIIMQDKNELLVSPKHRVYASLASKKSLSSSVLNTFTTDCSLKCSSFDQIGTRSLSASAKYCLSSGSDNNAPARFNCCGETFSFKLTNLGNISFILSNLSSEICSNSQSSSECSFNSSNIYLCEYRFNEYLCANLFVNESFFNKENAMLASITNFIYNYSLDFFENLSLTRLANLKQSSLVSVLFFVNSSSSSNNLALSSCLRTSCFVSSDQFTQVNSLISDLTLSGIENVTDAIYNSPLSSNSFDFFNCFNLETIILRNISDHLMFGCLSIISLNSSGTDKVIVAILYSFNNCVDKHKYVNTYKSFGLKNLSSFSLQKITDVYSALQNKSDKEIYFLNSRNEPIKVLGIEKVPYSGKIYDVDVENDIVFVKRDSVICEDIDKIAEQSSDENKLINVMKNEKEETGLIGKEDFINERTYASQSTEAVTSDNLDIDKKENEAVASTLKNLSQDINNYSNAKYINFSVYGNDAEDAAAVASTVRHQPQELDSLPREILGANPSRSASASSSSEDNDNLINELNNKYGKQGEDWWFSFEDRKEKVCHKVEGTPVWSGNSNNGTCSGTGCPAWNSSGRYGGAYVFDGVNDNVNVSVIQGINSTSLWIKNSTSNSWKHVAWNYTAYFINGVAGTLDEYPLNASGTNVRIGVNGSTWFNGTIDAVQIWNRSLSAAEVYQLYASNLYKYNSTQWYLYVNQSKNATAGLTEGAYNYQSFVNDKAGNIGQSDLRYVTVDTIYPLISYVLPTFGDGAMINRNYIYVNVSLSDTNLANVTYKLFYSNNTLINSTTYSTNVNSINWSGLADGSYKYNVSMYDLALNYNATATRNITLNASVISGSSLGMTTGKIYVNYNENVALNLTIPASAYAGYALDKVWANVLRSNGSRVNLSMSNSVFEMPNNQQIQNGINMSGNVLLMHMNNDSAYENSTKVYDYSGQCYDNETMIMTIEEVDCSSVNCDDENYFCEKIDGTENINNVMQDEEVGVRGEESGESESEDEKIRNELINEDKKEKRVNNVTLEVRKFFTDYNYFNNINYINVSIYNYSVEDAPVTLVVRDRPLKSDLHRYPSSILGSSSDFLNNDLDSKVKTLGWSASTSSFSQKCFVKKWKYFYELNGSEKVATLNNETGEMEWQKPTAYQEFDNGNDDMYKIELEDENGKESEMVVSEKHRVYSKSMSNDLSFSTSSLVLNTSTNDCLLKCSSLDQIGIALESANAKYAVSSLSGIEEFACSRKDSNEFSGTKDILSFINLSNSSISSEDKELNFRILGLCLFNSSSNCSGEYNFNPFKNKIFLVIPNPVNPVNTIPVSITSSIYFNEGYDFFNLSCIDLLTFLANSSASFSVNLDLETNSLNLSYPSVSSTLLVNASLATSDQLITLNTSIFFFNSSGIDIVKCSILNLSCVSKTQKTQQIQVFKDFGLQKITETYEDFESGKEIYFLDSENRAVLVKNIEKVSYSGKIYDVDVENDIVLVKRGNSSLIWSGNSNNGTVYNGTQVCGQRGDCAQWGSAYGKLGQGGWQFDGVNDYVDVPYNASLNITTGQITLSAWIKPSDSGGDDGIIGNGNGAQAYINGAELQYNSNSIKFIPGGTYVDNGIQSSSIISQNTWSHIVATYNGTGSFIYINGVLNINATKNNNLSFAVGEPWSIGQRYDRNNGNSFNGSIDEVAIWNRSLSAAEVLAIYNLQVSNYYNATYINTGLLGDYGVTYYANATSGEMIFDNVVSNFSVQNTSIRINAPASVNTTDVVNVNGIINRTNGSVQWNIVNNLFLMKLNNVTVSSNILNHSSFTTNGYNGTNVNVSNVVQINLTNAGNVTSYNDDFSTTKYTNDAYQVNTSLVGYDGVRGVIFSYNHLANSIGNITYKFNSSTKFFNASVFVTTGASETGGGANTSLWYSLNGTSWNILNSTTANGAAITGTPAVNNYNMFFIRLLSNTNGLSVETPVTNFVVNYTSYEYSSNGNYISSGINLANVTYILLKWDRVLNGGEIKIQLRESDDNSTWGAWSTNYTNYLTNDISSFTKPYIQYKAWLSTGNNLSLTPVLYDAQILYFNASTNLTGGYDYNITIPTNSLGPLPLEVSIVQNSQTGIVGLNSTNITVWARTALQYYSMFNYTNPSGMTNYSVFVNFTRADTGELVNGTISVNISNSSYSLLKTCSGSSCTASWLIPGNLSYGNYTVNISLSNVSAYYINSTIGYSDYLEEKNTTGNLYVANKTITDFSSGTDYNLYWNATINNTGKASMNNVHVYNYVAATDSAIKNISEITPCSRIYPNSSCNALMLITIDGGATAGSKFISWRANWTDNDGSISGGSGFISYTDMYVIISLNASLQLNATSLNKTIEHGSRDSIFFKVQSTGTDSVTNINISFKEGNVTSGYNLSSSWINFSTNWINGLAAGQSQEIRVNISIPLQTSSGNYSGIINVSSSNAGAKSLNLTITVPTNSSWQISPLTNLSYNRSFSLNTAGEIGNFTIINLGNINLTMNISYSPSRTTDYSAFGTALFETNYNVTGVITNPTSVNVTKGQNTTITLYHKGRSNALNDVGVNFYIFNETSRPTNLSMQEAFWIYELPPSVANVYLYLDGILGNKSELNKNLTIKIKANDDIGLNETRTTINITYGSTTVIINASSLCETFGECTGASGARTIVNYSANFTPTTAGLHSIKAIVYDNQGQIASNSSSTYNFTAYGTTTASVISNISSININDIDLTRGKTIYVNYSINNTGEVFGYSFALNFTGNSSIAANNYSIGNLSIGQNTSYFSQINISALTIPGAYNLTGTLRWRNPDNTYSTISNNLTINVLSNKSFNYTPSSLNLTVSSNSQNSTILIINNTGNDLLRGMNLSCYSGVLCTSFTIFYNETNFNITANSSRQVNISLTAPAGLEGGTYNGIMNISEQNISRTINIQAGVPETWTWSLSANSINSSKGASSSGNIEAVIISNTGNVNISFALNSTNSSIIGANVSSLLVPSGSNRSFMVNYSAPSTEGSYLVNITVANSSAIPTQSAIAVNLSVTRINITIIFPTQTLPLTNVTSGGIINITANATYGGSALTENVTWSAEINGTSCSSINYNYSNRWNINCSAPSLLNGRSYNLTLTITHAQYGSISQTEMNAISYRDNAPPGFGITRNNIEKGQNINLTVNITDNVNISSVWFTLMYPNLSYYVVNNSTNINLSLSNGLYVFNSLNLTEAGEYIANYSANDSTGNINSSLDWFEVYDRYYWRVRIVDYNSAVVANVNISLRRLNETIILLNNVTNSSGDGIFYVNKRFYDIYAKISGDELIIRHVNFSNVTRSGIYFNMHRMDSGALAETVAYHESFQGIASNSSNLSNNRVIVVFNYSGLSYDNANELEIVKCASWNYTGRACIGTWSVLSSSIDRDAKTVSANFSGFSSYFLSEDKCGNGVCEASYGETTTTCSADCIAPTTTVVGGGGGGSSVTTIQQNISLKDLAGIEDILKNIVNIEGVKVETTSIYKEMFAGETTTVRVKLTNTLGGSTKISLRADGDVMSMVFFESNEVALKSGESKSILIKIVTPKTIEPGNYEGDLIIKSGKKEGKIPITIRIIAPEGKLLDVKIQPLAERVAPGEILRIQTDLLNLGKTSKVDIQFDLQLLDINTGDIITRREEAFAVETKVSTIKNLTIPEYAEPGRYLIKGTAYYSNPEQTFMQASSIAYIDIGYPILLTLIFGVPLWSYLIVLFLIIFFIIIFFYIRMSERKKKRFKISVDVAKLPQPGPNSAFIGKIAETGIRTFVDLNKLQMHTLVAGATGGGKTVAAQDLVESALLHKKSVIIFDPTAQWTGFFRKSDDKGMLRRYQYFDMKMSDSHGFNGTIKTIHDPYELINLEKYINRPGEITIFNISNLTPKEIDIVVASTIQQIFKSNPEESRELKTLIVYDEVHRLLPKFGGSGKGFIQLERAVREFRKWGVGLVLISQVLSDFVGEIKANIGTEVQMGTKYEDDLERINLKYGEDVLKSVVKAPIGTGMIVNTEYNSGKPYFVSFRPLLHSTKRLSNEELKKYEEYFETIEDLEYQTEKIKETGLDVLDIELEIKLAKTKIKEGQFQMADMYFESLLPRVEEMWKNLGKKPMHLVKEKILKTEVEEGILRAEKEREKYEKENPEEELSFADKIKEFKKQAEEKKKKGKDVSKIEIKIKDLERRLEPFKGKVNAKDAEEINKEMKELDKEINE